MGRCLLYNVPIVTAALFAGLWKPCVWPMCRRSVNSVSYYLCAALTSMDPWEMSVDDEEEDDDDDDMAFNASDDDDEDLQGLDDDNDDEAARSSIEARSQR